MRRAMQSRSVPPVDTAGGCNGRNEASCWRTPEAREKGKGKFKGKGKDIDKKGKDGESPELAGRRNELQKQLDKVVELNGAEAAEGADTSPPGRTKTGAGTPEPDKEPIDGHQDEESDSEEDLAEGRARQRKILRLTVGLGIPNIRPEGGPHP